MASAEDVSRCRRHLRAHDRLCRRGEEVAHVHPWLARSCLMRAAEHALQASQLDRRHEDKVTSLLLRLEQPQPTTPRGEGEGEEGMEVRRDRRKDRARVEGFAMQIFASADGAVRAWEMDGMEREGDGRYEAELAKKMYAAATFLDASRACPEGEEGSKGMEEDKKKEIENYANWKAAQLMQSAKRKRERQTKTSVEEGDPNASETQGEAEEVAPTSPEEEEELERAFAKLDQQDKEEQQEKHQPKKQEKMKRDPKEEKNNKNSGDSYETNLPPKQVLEATKHARNAVSALQFNDVATAKENLEKALRLLK